MSRKQWTPAEKETLRVMYASHTAEECAAALGVNTRSIYNQVRRLQLRKSSEWIRARARERSLRPDHGGRASHFQPGAAPWNAGKPHPSRGRSVETQFKRGRAPHEARNYRPIGSLRLSKDGYLQRKVTDDQHVALANRWECVHRLVWIDANGPIPPACVVAFLPGMQTISEAEITPDRLELITRAESMRRNTIHNYPAEIVSTCQLIGKARSLIRKRESHVVAHH